MIGYYIRHLRTSAGLSEIALAEKAGIARLTLRALESDRGNPTVQSIQAVAEALGTRCEISLIPKLPCRSEDSTLGISEKILRDGFESWPIHLMEMVDTFRGSKDPRLLLLPPVRSLDPKLYALLNSTVFALSEEVGLQVPEWAEKTCFLKIPWFVSEVENLKAMALLESPLAFRRNNIFTLENFLRRA